MAAANAWSSISGAPTAPSSTTSRLGAPPLRSTATIWSRWDRSASGCATLATRLRRRPALRRRFLRARHPRRRSELPHARRPAAHRRGPRLSRGPPFDPGAGPRLHRHRSASSLRQLRTSHDRRRHPRPGHRRRPPRSPCRCRRRPQPTPRRCPRPRHNPRQQRRHRVRKPCRLHLRGAPRAPSRCSIRSTIRRPRRTRLRTSPCPACTAARRRHPVHRPSRQLRRPPRR
jgi:hypothetical protein